MPSSKDGIGDSVGQNFGSVPPPVPTCPPPFDSDVSDTGNGVREGVSVAFRIIYPRLYMVIQDCPKLSKDLSEIKKTNMIAMLLANKAMKGLEKHL